MQVALITIGDELLSGDTVNTNAAWLGRELTSRGVTVTKDVTLPDDVSAIASAVAALADAHDAVIITGGLGPTHDDLTMAGVAAAFDRELTEHQEALAWLTEHGEYAAEDLSAGTTHLPAGARHLPNEVGVAPGAVVENVYVLPGVPAEMKAMFDRIAEEFAVGESHAVEIETPAPESAIAQYLPEVEAQFDVTVGSYPGENVTVRIRGSMADQVDAAAEWLTERIREEEDYR